MQKTIKETYLRRLDQLIIKGEEIIKNVPVDRIRIGMEEDEEDIDNGVANTWRTNCFNLLSQIKPKDDYSFVSINSPAIMYESNKDRVEKVLSFMRAVKDDFELGFLDSLSEQIEAILACDYMDIAEKLLNDPDAKKNGTDHIPAAVLVGVTLEHTLRTLCDKNGISLQKSNGEPKTMNPLIDDLKTLGIFNELKAKQLRSWADIRNAAAHGHFTEFKRDDVLNMIAGVNQFLADYI